MMRFRVWAQLVAGVTTAGLVACGTDTKQVVVPAAQEVPEQPTVIAELRADANRDGEVHVDDDSDKEPADWDKASGAIFLANIDDDGERCKATGDDIAIAKCNDAADEIVNGDDDILDLARIKSVPWPDATEDATGSVAIVTKGAKPLVRLFKKTGANATAFEALAADYVFTREELQEGFELAIEAKDIVRDPASWDGYVEVELTVTSSLGDASSTVKLRVAPVLTFHHLLPAEKIWVSNTRGPGNAETRADLASACEAAGIAAPEEITESDPWTQDFFEPAYMSMPGKKGAQHVMRVNYRSANVFEPKKPKSPLRPAGKLVFKLRGKDVAGVQQFDLSHDQEMDTLNSFGNFETVPPYEKGGVSYPFGRVVRGMTKSYFPDKTFEAMIEAQAQQPSIAVDTSWLLVAHVDETVSFVKAPTPRGWMLLVNDAPLAKKMLEEQVKAGNGKTRMFVGKEWVDYETNDASDAEITIEGVLADQDVMQASAEAAAEVDAQLAILVKELGLDEDEIIRVPFLHTTYAGKSAAYQPGIVNGVYVSDTHFGAPDPHGPIIGGKDIFKAAFEAPMKKIGITVDWIEDWEYHVGIGEVHCGTNSTRAIPEARWWESGR